MFELAKFVGWLLSPLVLALLLFGVALLLNWRGYRGLGLGAGLPACTDVQAQPDSLHLLGRWLPDADSLSLSTRALKEYMGLAVLTLRGL